jgi:hypothetical protein
MNKNPNVNWHHYRGVTDMRKPGETEAVNSDGKSPLGMLAAVQKENPAGVAGFEPSSDGLPGISRVALNRHNCRLVRLG